MNFKILSFLLIAVLVFSCHNKSNTTINLGQQILPTNTYCLDVERNIKLRKVKADSIKAKLWSNYSDHLEKLLGFTAL
jgi:hypothetical protein